MAYKNDVIYMRLEQLMTARHMIAFDLTKNLGISSGNISDWKSGKACPGTEKLVILADYFDVPVDYLLGRDGYVVKHDAQKDCSELNDIYKDLDREGKVSVLAEAYKQKRRIIDEQRATAETEEEAQRGAC